MFTIDLIEPLNLKMYISWAPGTPNTLLSSDKQVFQYAMEIRVKSN